MNQNTRVCPLPLVWQKLHEQLLLFVEHFPVMSAPPTPLVLSGWAVSNDDEKMDRWRRTVQWAIENDCFDIVDRLQTDEFYYSAKISTYEVGPTGGPVYLPWNFDPRQCPTPDVLSRYMQSLSSNWLDIAGSAIGEMTSPLRFTGRKKRALVVGVVADMLPPWGEWHTLSPDAEKRASFKNFRQSINRMITPHQIDHVLFIRALNEMS